MGLKRGSYRTIRRFFETPLPWPTLLWEFFRVHCLDPNHVYLVAGDETVVGKAGTETYGVGRFVSSLHDQPIRGLSFFCLCLGNNWVSRNGHAVEPSTLTSDKQKNDSPPIGWSYRLETNRPTPLVSGPALPTTVSSPATR